jgi:hypothetical protein
VWEKNFDSPAGSSEAADSRSAIRRLARAEASSCSVRITLPRYAITSEAAIERSDFAVVEVTPACVANASATLDVPIAEQQRLDEIRGRCSIGTGADARDQMLAAVEHRCVVGWIDRHRINLADRFRIACARRETADHRRDGVRTPVSILEAGSPVVALNLDVNVGLTN